MIHVVLIATIIFSFNLCWLCLHLHRRTRCLELQHEDHEQRLQRCEGRRWSCLISGRSADVTQHDSKV